MSFLKYIAVCYFCNGSLFEHEAPLYVEMQIGECLIRQVHIILPVFITVSACSSNVSGFQRGFYSSKNSSNSSFHPLRGIFANLFLRQKFGDFLFVQR